MSWDVVLRDRVAAYVWPPVPLPVDRLIPGRWPQPDPLRYGVDAVMSDKSQVLQSIWRDGQTKAITARWELRDGSEHPMPTEIWPDLDLQQSKAWPTRGNDLLRFYLLIYEGNHRWAIAQMLQWSYVLVEPQLWIYGDELSRRPHIVDQYTSELLAMMPMGSGRLTPRHAQPARADKRPMDPEEAHRPFHGRELDVWLAFQGRPMP